MSARWYRLCLAADVPPGALLGRTIGDSGEAHDRVCVASGADGEVVAMLDRCPHRDVALSGGVVHGSTVVCPGHFWRFDLASGERTDLPRHAVTLYPTRLVDGWIEALVPDPAPPVPMREWLLGQARDRTT
ncbi:Rieske (2Fe-2S) protein [Nocardioides litoris]|uniref:Rieske (2Fe-2S) protein n=1 Tax=Nocardioides litoris TaxID=1926648 RepID=UPI001B86B9E3|nr:Rieske (2Fe-2S) protein [Nocardioides litoris]